MPDQGKIEEIRMAHLASIQEVMARYPSHLDHPPVLLDNMGSVLISPFGPVARADSVRLPDSQITQQLPPVARPDAETAEAGLGLSLLALAGGVCVIFAYIRKMLE